MAELRSITPEQAHVLLAVWKVQLQPLLHNKRLLKGRAVTIAELAEELGKSEATVRQMVKRLMASGFLIDLTRTDERGRTTSAYCIPDGRTIRLPETAHVLRELRQEDPDPDRPQQIKLEPFNKRMLKAGVSAHLLRDHIAYMIRKHFLIPYPSERATHVWFGTRTIAENEYLDLLADEYRPPSRRD
jgi:biotin operon repressor